MGQHTRLLQTGEPAAAVILELRDADPTPALPLDKLENRGDEGTDDHRQIELLLDVLPSHRPPFRAIVCAVISHLETALVQPGMQVLVKFDPDDPSKVALAGFAWLPRR